MTYTLDDLRSSFALLDYRTDNGESVPNIASSLGVRIDDLMHVAEQRGMRVALTVTGQADKIIAAQATGQFTPIRLDARQQQIMAYATAAEMEAIAATLLMVRKANGTTA